MGNPQQQLVKAKKNIAKLIGAITRQSNVYSTAAWGNTNQPGFLNEVIVVQTKFDALKNLQIILSIEKNMGRIRTKKYAPRNIDIDILFFNKEIIDTKELCIPHPQIQNRNFVLVPLNQLSPNFKHPILGKTIHQLMNSCPDKLAVHKIV
jgi:2-amino-4-hydroxy-6-hydroxymethyldihydropteridine diphosphokinase